MVVVKRCLVCGRYFTPDHRVGQRQKVCFTPECRKQRKKTAQDDWVKKNPGYFAGRYPYVKAWRQKKMIQDEIPRPKRPQKIVFIMPDDTIRMIQDEILLKRSGKRTFRAHGYG
jgi:hypothetical protein